MVRVLLLCLALLAAGPAFALRPVAKWWAKPGTLGLKYRQLELTTADQVGIVAWLIEPSAKLTEKFFAEGYVRAIGRFLAGGKA